MNAAGVPLSCSWQSLYCQVAPVRGKMPKNEWKTTENTQEESGCMKRKLERDRNRKLIKCQDIEIRDVQNYIF